MRIIQVTNSFGTDLGGAERIARWLHLALLDRQVDAHIIALQSCNKDDVPSSHSLDLENPRDPRALIRLTQVLNSLVDSNTVVHAHLFPTILWLSALRQSGRFTAPLTMTEHNTDNRRRRMAAGRLLDRGIYRGMDGIAAISEGTKGALTAAYPNLEPKTQLVSNGTILEHSTFPLHQTALPAGETVRLISVGRLTEQKNLEAALEALARLKNRNWHYTIVGSGPLRTALEELALAGGIAEQVTFAGHVEDPYPLLEQSDIFLMPSRWEGFGLAAVEAMNAGLACIISDVGGLSEVVGGGAPTPVAPNDIMGLSNNISMLIDDRTQRADLARIGFERSLMFGLEQMVDRYLVFWQSVMQRQPTN